MTKFNQVLFASLMFGAFGLVSPPSADASAVVDFDSETVTRMNDGLPVLIIKEDGSYTSRLDYDLAKPAGRGKVGYATQRSIKGDDVLNTNKGVNGAVVTSLVSGVSIQTSNYGAGQLRELNRQVGKPLRFMANGPDGQERRAVRNYSTVSQQWRYQKMSKSRFAGGPTYRGNFNF